MYFPNMPQNFRIDEDTFAREYYNTRNAVQSAIKAGWSENTANACSYKLLENIGIQNKIREMEEKAKENFELSEERVISELMKIGFANVSDYLDYDETGEIKYKASSELSRNETAAIQEITNSKKFDKDGNQLGVDVKLKMNDKLKALEMLGRKIGMFNDKLSLTKQVINVSVDDDDDDELNNLAIPND
tara:strand:- start:4 stop:570 length:567 start_codon:yes stop_codon:yes gene_type:complete